MVLFSLAVVAIWSYTVDDAYIVLRYARNVKAGLGAVFNPGERVEGCTSPLWLGLISIGSWLPVAPIVTAKLISVVSVCGLLAACARRWRATPMLAAAVMAMIGLQGPLLIATTSGLETALNSVLVGLALIWSHRTPRWNAKLTVIGAAALLCRPENGLIVGAHGLWLWSTRKSSRRRLIGTAAVWLGVMAGLTAIRYGYYGRWVSNTSVSKLSQPFEHLGFARMYLGLWLSQTWHILAFVTAGIVIRRTRAISLNAVVIMMAQAAFVVLAGGDWMPGLRFMLPTTVVGMVVAGDVSNYLGRCARISRWRCNRRPGELSNARRPQPMLACAVMLALIGMVTLQQAVEIRPMRWALASYEKTLDALRAGPVAYLQSAATPDDTIAARDIGVLGYGVDCRVLDLVGLTDAHIAETSGMYHRDRLDLDYVFSREPRFFMIQSEKSESGAAAPCRLAMRILSDDRFTAYELRGRWPLPGREYCEVYERRVESADKPSQDSASNPATEGAVTLQNDLAE